MTQEGSIAPLPPQNAPHRVRDWDAIAEKARKRPGKSILAAKDEKYSLAKSLWQRRRPPFITDRGRVVINVRNSSIHEDGRRYGDIYFTYVPKGKE